MKKFSLELPSLYGDHHVIEVRRLLFELPGVEDVYASSSFHYLEVSYDPEKVGQTEMLAKLDQAGYLGELSFPVEPGTATSRTAGNGSYFRHTEVYENTRKVVSFAQTVKPSGRALWPCPGVGVLKVEE